MTNPNCEYGANFIAIHTLAQWSKCTVDGTLPTFGSDAVSCKSQILHVISLHTVIHNMNFARKDRVLTRCILIQLISNWKVKLKKPLTSVILLSLQMFTIQNML